MKICSQSKRKKKRPVRDLLVTSRKAFPFWSSAHLLNKFLLLVAHHCIFHVIATVGDDSHDGIGTDRVAVHAVEVVHSGPHQRALGSMKEVQLVIRAVPVVINWKPHGLLSCKERKLDLFRINSMSSHVSSSRYLAKNKAGNELEELLILKTTEFNNCSKSSYKSFYEPHTIFSSLHGIT